MQNGKNLFQKMTTRFSSADSSFKYHPEKDVEINSWIGFFVVPGRLRERYVCCNLLKYAE